MGGLDGKSSSLGRQEHQDDPLLLIPVENFLEHFTALVQRSEAWLRPH